MRVMPLSYLSKTGIITASLTTSQVSITPRETGHLALDALHLHLRISALDIASSQSAVTVCQHSGWPLTRTPRAWNQRAAVSRRSSVG